MKRTIAFLLFALISNVTIAAGNSQQCSELIDKMEDMSELKKVLHCLNDAIDSANSKSLQQGKTAEQTSTQRPSLDKSIGPMIKKSKSNICHGKGTKYYKQTKRYSPFDSIQACLDSGGRLPKG